MTKTLGNVGGDMYYEDFDCIPSADSDTCTECGEHFDLEDLTGVEQVGELCPGCLVTHNRTCSDCGDVFDYDLTESLQGRVIDGERVPWVVCSECLVKCMAKLVRESEDLFLILAELVKGV